MDTKWNLTKNKQILCDYNKYRIKKLSRNFIRQCLSKRCLYRNDKKLIYECVDQFSTTYDVFINFVMPIPIKFWAISIYEFEEKYPENDDFGYRAWKFDNKSEALKKYISLI